MAAMKEIPYKIYLEENEMPQAWYNVRADMKNKPAPLLNPATGNLPVPCQSSQQRWQMESYPYSIGDYRSANLV